MLAIRGDSYRLRAERNRCLISRPPLTVLRSARLGPSRRPPTQHSSDITNRGWG
ncbi:MULTISPECIES: hypothetical protein [unclassified Bradyrhizobium]|uniref:hypothetical protein n=1 Tax=unclassified Bradyrhizobium TaxID=2631580 RepID=UPI0035C69B49